MAKSAQQLTKFVGLTEENFHRLQEHLRTVINPSLETQQQHANEIAALKEQVAALTPKPSGSK